ncbi:PREDICTED: uncharacterized protein LOC106126089 [Papilio xuthus]|uniref:Uncharacterized protein LOC106126089 n=1 Tax=Papilio xuthus TaxID=66420 RepID=A0AAJ6ZTP3_PAPXU|nr:PREDICTED: uncharacterized protein LOC106126089 [Papilio xuthus]
MWRQAVLLMATFMLAGAWDITYYTRTRLYPSLPRVECFDYPDPEWRSAGRYRSVMAGGARGGSGSPALNNLLFDDGTYSSTSFRMRRAFSRRFDSLPFSSSKEDIVKEHAKLVREINGLKQAAHKELAPSDHESRDYDDSIYPEEIDLGGRTVTAQPTGISAPPFSEKRRAPDSALLVPTIAGASQPAAWLTGSSTLARRPFTPARPGGAPPTVRVCLPPALPSAPLHYPKPTPNLFQRLLDGILSK